MDIKRLYSYQESQKELQSLLKKDEKVFSQLIKNSFDMIVLMDADGIQHYVSESCKRVLGYTPEELTEIPVIEEMIHPDDREKVRDGFGNILQHKANGGTQYRHRHKDGGWVYLEAFGTNRLENPLIHSVILNVRDITERKEAEIALQKSEERLRELNATKDRFFSIIGHDLRIPFNGILGLSDLLADQIREENYEGLDEYAEMIQKSAQKAFDLLTNLLEWSRAHTGRITFNPEGFDLVNIIDDVIMLFEDSTRQKSITIAKETPAHIPVLADKAMVHTILRNLVSNGIKFTEPGGNITISIEKEDNQLKISVSDTGVGIPKEDMDNLFCIEHAHSTKGTNNESGTGLGLLLCREFTEMHEGNIWVESGSEGSRFFFTLPRR